MSCCKKLPEKILAWRMFGAGFEKFGENDKPSVMPMPAIADDELLVEINAIGLCFSDVKLIRAGEQHPRVISKDLSKDPVIPGHEAVMTIVKVGDKIKDKFKAGRRYIIQADIYVNGMGFAYGYALDGGMAQYSVINQKVLNGDEGCYLLPIADSMPSAVAALLEPWTCVLASYRLGYRKAPLANGKMLFVFGPKHESYEFGAVLSAAGPSAVTLVNAPAAFAAEVSRHYPKAKIIAASTLPENEKFDDIFLCGTDRATGEKAAKTGKTGACVSFLGDYSAEDWLFDVGSIHYQGWFYQGTRSNNLSDAYGRNVRSALKKGGVCWLPGGAGAMGQMHTQLALSGENGPSKVLVTDMDKTRIEHVRAQLGPIAAKNNIEFKLLNPADFAAPADFDRAVREFAPNGFDDIVMLVPVPALVSAYAKFLAEDGLMNIFAGIPAGKEGALPIAGIVEKGFRFIGSSGSKTEDLRHTIRMVEEGKLNPVSALAAIGGMNALKQGLDAVANARFPGKTVIFPNCEDMPLTAVDAISSLADGIEKTLAKDGTYTLETEKVLFDKYLS
ncbi:MAG: Sorbitol dehydrogenase [Lentisphaerae bacterium ADurb.Bin242]|nr:MAG: Sorbitol dehydrogenase [Lentisphaerae bacterium ADurb.Bin242]